jgi:Mg2+-importing ATPase
MAIVVFVLVLPYTPLADLFGFTPLPWKFYPPLAGILFCYLLSVEIAKRFFFHRMHKLA